MRAAVVLMQAEATGLRAAQGLQQVVRPLSRLSKP